ncbi:MAG TPA: penicillin acylase family protein [Actinomycetes bacterium]|nr:penicillin acylase family protein [Actinomycetes bacterium]
MRRIAIVALVLLLVPAVAATARGAPGPAAAGGAVEVAGLEAPARVVRDADGIAHVLAGTRHDLYFLQGQVHAQDRLFQMDVRRRQANGTLAELLGPAALPTDVELRTIGLHRAAERSLPALSKETRSVLQAYADGVNAWVAGHPLPPEYGALELTAFRPWTPLDSVAVGKLITFSLSFDLEDIDRTVALLAYRQAGQAAGFDGARLFSEDLWRSQPFTPASTVPDATGSETATATTARQAGPRAVAQPDARLRAAAGLVRRYAEKARKVPLLAQALDGDHSKGGSNQWAVAGRLAAGGHPLVANDPHLALDAPSTFYPVHLKAGRTDAIGSGFAGAPGVIVGHNRSIAWGATVNPSDVTDVYAEQVVPDSSSPSGLATLYQGQREPVIPIPEVFRQNNPGNGTPDDVAGVEPAPNGPVPAATLIVPRRNNGPIIQLDQGTGAALSVQYTGFSATREIDTFMIWDDARGLGDFRRGLQLFDVGGQNWAYADTAGNIAYFTSAELPVREDLQAGTVNGLPPYFIRDGAGGNEWLPVQHPQPGQAIPYEILPPEEMPHTVNPPAGYFVNANNDPIGTTLDNDPLNQLRPGGGIYYLNPGYDGIRGGRITELIRAELAGDGSVSFGDMQRIQADTALVDAQFFVPHVVRALRNARRSDDPALQAMAGDPAVAEAVGRLARWSRRTPTGIPEGYDARDVQGRRLPPTDQEVDASVAATVYAVWRGQFIRNVVDARLAPFGVPLPDGQQALTGLKHLLDTFADTAGVGASRIDFFAVQGVADPADRRDLLLLRSVQDALAKLAGPDFQAAFGGSTDQDDYRWGRLHRVVLDHPLDGPLNIPPGGGAFPPPLADLPGIPTDGGFDTVDASSHDARADASNDFMFGSGPANRFVGQPRPGRVVAESSLPGGTSGVPGERFYVNLLPRWLTNEAFPLRQRLADLDAATVSATELVPAS